MNAAALYEYVTTAIQHQTGAADSLLHVHAGMALLLLSSLITRKPLASGVPFAIVVAAAAANEILDRINHGNWEAVHTAFDLLQTIFWPLVLTLMFRVKASREQRDGSRECAEDRSSMAAR